MTRPGRKCAGSNPLSNPRTVLMVRFRFCSQRQARCCVSQAGRVTCVPPACSMTKFDYRAPDTNFLARARLFLGFKKLRTDLNLVAPWASHSEHRSAWAHSSICCRSIAGPLPSRPSVTKNSQPSVGKKASSRNGTRPRSKRSLRISRNECGVKHQAWRSRYACCCMNASSALRAGRVSGRTRRAPRSWRPRQSVLRG